MQNNLTNLTTQIHQNLQKVCEKYGLEKLEIDSDYYLLPFDTEPRIDVGGDKLDGEIPALQSEQIRQILVHLQGVLGENPEYKKWWNNTPENDYKTGYRLAKLKSLFELQAEALCQKWLDGLEPLFRREPEMVLTQLNEVLENLLKKPS